MIVADVTLISYFTMEGEHTPSALRVRRCDPDWVAPLLWESEFGNVLRRFVRGGAFDLDLALAHLDVARDLVTGYAISISEALRVASKSGCSVYDAQYASLALQLDIPLVTHNRQLLAAFQGVATH
ncbi:MAG: type II toxin-antitoxin system VapC family toxin, partial [Rhodothermales bacterium]